MQASLSEAILVIYNVDKTYFMSVRKLLPVSSEVKMSNLDFSDFWDCFRNSLEIRVWVCGCY